ncbi:MAG: hypothetical protein FWC09_05040 [Lachnospiraceae bacterium]|nr:hypothetical protein [Lachnospiraceae bacterium]
MKKLIILTIVVSLMMIFVGCGKGNDNENAARNDVAVIEENPTLAPTPEPEPEPESPSNDEIIIVDSTDNDADAQATPAVITIEAEDGNIFNSKENPVPFGQWVFFQEKNFTSGEYEPFYVRIINVVNDSAAIEKAIEGYSGIMDLSLSEDQARDIEFRMFEYEVYFAPDYACSEYGITPPTVRISANPTKTVSFQTEGGMSYIGVGSSYDLNINKGSDRPQPGDTITEKSVFTILKNYDEGEYVFRISWYDGEIVTEKARELYFASK